jgi:hypothetical protein
LEPVKSDYFEAWMIGRLAILYICGFWGRNRLLSAEQRENVLALYQVSDHLSDKERHWWWAESHMSNPYDLAPSRRMQMQLICCAKAVWSEIDWVNLNDLSHCLALSHLLVVTGGFNAKEYLCGVASSGAI